MNRIFFRHFSGSPRTDSGLTEGGVRGQASDDATIGKRE